MSMPDTDMIELRDVVKHYRTRGRGLVHALDGVSLTVPRGRVLGLVGESGCGKSTTARLLTGLERPTSGTVRVAGRDLARVSARDRRAACRDIQLVFQDPYSSLDPRQRIAAALTEVVTVHRLATSRVAARAQAVDLLELVGLPTTLADRYPHELSGGQRQRVGIARALAVRPQILVLDEPVSALDVSVRAEIINLLNRLRAELSLTMLFISHDLAMVRHLADEVAVMYLGTIVEQGTWQRVCDDPTHPYTRALHAAVPRADPRAEAARGTEPEPVAGEVPDAARPPRGCRFHPRCPLVVERCRAVEPALSPAEGPHRLACHVMGEASAAGERAR